MNKHLLNNQHPILSSHSPQYAPHSKSRESTSSSLLLFFAKLLHAKPKRVTSSFAVARAVIRGRPILREKADCKQFNDSHLRNNESIEIKPLNRWSQSALPFLRQKGIHSKIFLQEVQPLRRYSLHDELGMPENFACRIWNPGLWNAKYISRNPESH